MTGRRVIVHAGFHKTGTTSAQRFLRANGKHIWPRCALVLPGRLRKGAARMATRFSRLRTNGLLSEFAHDLHDVLSAIDAGNRAILISDENLAGRMPGRDGHPDYSATPTLMAKAETVIHDVFGADADVTFHFTTRPPDAWLLSSYKHNLRTSRLVMDLGEYRETIAPAADLARVVGDVDAATQGHISTRDLADLTGDFGPAEPLIDLINLPAHLRKRLTPHPRFNAGPDDGMIDALLDLNRSALSDDALATAKADLLGKAQTNDR